MKFLHKIFSKPEENKIGISLSGGGVRGIAHLGVLKALNEHEIFPDEISGVSAGAIAGAFYCDGQKPDDILKIFDQTSLFKFAKLGIPRKGFMTMEKVEQILKENLNADTFDQLKIPLTVAATNLTEGRVEYFNSGSIAKKVIASASIPVVFKPVELNGDLYADGGIFDNLPVDPLLKSCNKIIASHVNPLDKEENLDGMLDIAERVFHLAIASSVHENSKDCHLFIEIPELRKFSLLKVENIHEIFEIGYKSTLNILKSNTL